MVRLRVRLPPSPVMENLEKKLEKPHWSQWVPLYGIHKIKKDEKDNKPTLFDDEKSALYRMSISYHVLLASYVFIGSAAGATYGLYELVKNYM